MANVPASFPVAAKVSPARYPWYHWRRWGFNFLVISIAVHLLLGVGAGYLIVQTIQAKRKQTFTGPPKGANAPTRALEHQVQMQKKQHSMSAPPAVKRVTTTGNARVALPAMPAMPHTDMAIVPMTMAGMGVTGISMGTGQGGGEGGGGGNGAGLNLFGLRTGGAGLLGTFFDLKQTPNRRPTKIGENSGRGLSKEAQKEYQVAVSQYIKNGMDDRALTSRYFKGAIPLYATQIFIPRMLAKEGPKAFNLESQVEPSRWIVHYKGAVIAPESGTYRFVGVCDDVMVVRFDGRIVLDCGSMYATDRPPARFFAFDGLEAMMGGGSWFKGCGEGSAFDVEAGQTYPIDIVIGEWPGGEFKAYLQILKEGMEYQKDSKNNPILPLFRVAPGKTPTPAKGTAPVFMPDGPIWKNAPLPASLP